LVYLSCSYIPYEIPLAAGMPATRGIFEGPLPTMEGYLPRDFCPYARAFIRQYGDKDMVAIAESCDAMRRAYDVLSYWNLAGAVYFVDVPRTYDPEAVSFYAEELKGFASKLSDSGTAPRDEFSERLTVAINGMNQIRKELSCVFDLASKRQLSAVKATQLAINVNQLLACFPSAEDPLDPLDPGPSHTHNLAPGMFDSLIEQIERMIGQALSESSPFSQDRDRISVGISGTCLLDLSLIECIENAGLDVVFVDSCIPLRTYDFVVDSKTTCDPFYMLAEAYLRKAPCPRMFQGKERIWRLYELASDYGVRGLIYFAPKFCDQAYYDFIEIRHGLRSLGRLPVLLLEGQYGMGRTGQVLTRVEAFREMLEGTQILKAGK
jgi:benzoyl-CoA reductase/2-hydroxyglutaryl-CoA dehydratase subunit BcrC/BadD/HgdB